MKELKLLVCFLLLIRPAFAQLTIDDHTYSQNQVVQKLAGKGVKITNVTFDCPYKKGSPPYGYFEDNTGTLGIEAGLVMTTGSAINALGPNNSDRKSQDNGNDKQETELSDLLTDERTIYDACNIEFDITVENNQLLFSYVFGSEEYPEFVHSYHDVFGFFISGPGISGKQNLAVLPNTGLPVDVKTVNDTTNPQFYIANGLGAFPELNLDLQYDGYTTVLQASANVIPCQTYHLKLAIADVKDGIYDSGVFIENNSIKSVQSYTTKVIYEHPKYKTAIEGCNKAYVVFKRTVRDTRLAIPITLKIGGTATSALDYAPIQTSITIPAGKDSAFVTVDAFKDLIKDPGETVQLMILNNCPNIPPQDTITVKIEEDFKLKLAPVSACAGDSVQLNRPPDPAYTFVWKPVSGMSCTNCPSPFAKGIDSVYYPFVATDISSGCTATDSALGIFLPLPKADFLFAEDSGYTSLDIAFKNLSKNANRYDWSFGDQTSSNEFSPVHSYNPPLSEDQITYEVRLISGYKNVTCADTMIKKVIINPLFIPNLITVNDDLKNDEWVVRGIYPGSWELSIYNRWGGQVFKTLHFSNTWDPTNVTSGIYYYLLRYKEREIHGWLQVIK